jgi:hypothetical protein
MVCSGMGMRRDHSATRASMFCEAVVRDWMKSSAMHLIQKAARRNCPDGGDEGQAGEGVPLLGQVVVDQLFAGALEAVGALFEGQQGGVADEDGGVGAFEHGVEIGGRAGKGRRDCPSGERGCGRGPGWCGWRCRRPRSAGMEPLAGAANQQQGAHAALGGDGAAGQNAQAGGGGQSGDGDEADVGRARSQARGALGGRHAIDLIAEGELGIERRVLEVPHQGRGVEKADGGDAQTGGDWTPRIHCTSRVPPWAGDCVGRVGDESGASMGGAPLA